MLPYMSDFLCMSCFCRTTERRIGKTIRDNNLLKKGDKIAMALSGGKDSVLTLNVLNNYAKRIPDIELFAIYVDRGDAFSVDGMLAAKRAAEKINIPFHVVSFEKEFSVTMSDLTKIATKAKQNKCSVCGVFRRRLLDLTAKELGCNKLATGHNLTDEAQSYLMNFIRGELRTFGHLGPISPDVGFVQRIKPLRDIPNEEVREYVKIKGLPHFPKPCPCRDGSLRFNVMKHLEDIKKTRPAAEFSIVKVGDWIKARVGKEGAKFTKCKKCGELTSQEICKVCEYLELK